MLLKPLDQIDLEVGSFIHELLNSGDWLARRVDSVEFLSADTVRRQVTFDVDTEWIASRQPGGLVRPGLVVAPLTILTKQLLVDSDLADAAGTSLHIARRPTDSYLAWSAVAHRASEEGLDLAERPNVAAHVKKILTAFPRQLPRDLRMHQPAWDLGDPGSWDEEDHAFWATLLTTDWKLRYDIWTFTYAFPLVTYLQQDGVQIVKFRSRQDLRPVGNESKIGLGERVVQAATRLALRPRALIVPMPGPEQATRAHLRLTAPEGLEWSKIDVNRVVVPNPDPRPARTRWQRFAAWWSFLWRMHEDKGPNQPHECEVVLVADRAHVYVSDLPVQRRLQAHLAVHVPLTGFLRASLMAVLLSFSTILVGLCLHEDLAKADDIDAAVALLLLAPTVLSAYLVRPGEHELVSEMLRWVRYLVVLSMLAVYGAAGASILYLEKDSGHHKGLWQLALAVCAVPVVLIVTACMSSASSCRKTRRRGLATRVRAIGTVYDHGAFVGAELEPPPLVPPAHPPPAASPTPVVSSPPPPPPPPPPPSLPPAVPSV